MGNEQNQKYVDAWNAQYPVGTPIVYQEVIGLTPLVHTKTRSGAWLLGHGQAVVSLEGKTGGVCLEHLVKDEGHACFRSDLLVVLRLMRSLYNRDFLAGRTTEDWFHGAQDVLHSLEASLKEASLKTGHLFGVPIPDQKDVD